jgi:hypothetical protein
VTADGKKGNGPEERIVGLLAGLVSREGEAVDTKAILTESETNVKKASSAAKRKNKDRDKDQDRGAVQSRW